MESAPSTMEKQEMVSSFIEIAAGQTPETAAQFLEATNWNLEEAMQLFYLGNEGGNGVALSSIPQQVDDSPSYRENLVTNENVGKVGDDEVRAPLPVKRETLYGDASFVRLQTSSVIAFRNFEEESKQPAVWESDQSTASTANGSRDNLASLYRPPFVLMYQGAFDKAKVEAALMDKWLLVNMQSTEEFSSHMLNRDTWANEAVAQTIHTNFIFWQVYNDSSEGKKVCTYYHLVSVPAILIIDPVTGQNMHAWNGMVQPDILLEHLLPYMERGPKEYYIAHPLKHRREVSQDSTLPIAVASDSLNLIHCDLSFHMFSKISEEDEEVALALAASIEGVKGPIGSPAKAEESKSEKDTETCSKGKPSYPPLPEEPKVSRELLCRVGLRLPDGRRAQRSFLQTDSIKHLWSLCYSLLEDGETRTFHFTQVIPGASKILDYNSNQTFEEAGLSNSMLFLAWD